MPLFGSKKKKQKAEGEADGAAEAEASSSSSSSGVKRQLSKKEQKALEKEAKKEQKEKEKQEKAAKKAASKKEKQQRKESKKASKKASKKGSKKGSKKKDKKHQRRMGAQKVHRGRLFVRLDIAKNKLVAQVDEARDFHTVTKNDDANPYAVISIGPVPKGCDAVMKQQTKVVKGARKRAVFEQTFTFDISAITAGMRDNTRLRIELLHDAGRKRGTFLGGMAFTLNEIEDDDTPTQGWFRFLDEKKAINQNEPFRVMRKKEITKEIQELYGDVYGNKKPEERTYEEPVPAVDDAELIESSGAVGGKKKVGIDSFTYLQVLGRGAFGKVLLAELNDTKDIYAVKVLSKEAVIEDDDVEATMIERRVLSVGAECPCLTGLYATFQTPERLYFVMEFIKGGDLMFHASNLGSFTEPQAQLLLAEVCCGLWFLHDRGIVYRDLKLDNVMLTGDGHAKLADFGLCKEGIWGAATTTTFCGTPGYLAPEIIQELPYGVSVDWWSLGVMAYEMMIGETPFDGDDEEEIFEAVLSAPLEFHASISAHARSLVTGWLQRDPKQRLGSDSAGKDGIKQHPFFEGIDWELAAQHKLPPLYKPTGSSDTDNFDEEFTTMSLDNTPIDEDVIEDIDQDMFTGFTFVAGSAVADADAAETRAPLQEYGWYRPDLDRKTAETELSTADVGRFIVRESGSQPGCYAITVKFESRCWHGVITPGKTLAGGKYYKLYQKHKFKDIPSLVDYYHTNAIARDSNKSHVVLVYEGEEDE